MALTHLLLKVYTASYAPTGSNPQTILSGIS